MKLHLVEARINSFLESQIHSKSTDWYFPHKLVDQFHRNWTGVTEESLTSHYEQALKSDISQSWWKRDNYRPREIMLELIRIDPTLSWVAWKNLSDDHMMLDGRIDRFQYYCDTIIQTLRKADPRSILTHHHQDASIISLYLAGMFPEKYALYPGLQMFASFCKQIESPQIPVVDDLNRYAKVTAIILKYIRQNPLYPELEKKRMHPSHRNPFIASQVVYEIVSSK